MLARGLFTKTSLRSKPFGILKSRLSFTAPVSGRAIYGKMQDIEYGNSLEKHKDLNLPRPPPRVIREGDYVLLEGDDHFSKFIQVTTKGHFDFRKKKVKIDALIGQPWGCVFQVDANRKLVRTTESVLRGVKIEASAAEVDRELDDGSVPKDVALDNVAETTKPSVQKLDQDVLRDMKQKGDGGQQIIQALMDNSSTFGEKTEYSKEKYIAKKKKKYQPFVRVLQPEAHSIARSWYRNKPEKICYMREDALAFIMTMSNVQYGSNVGIIETCNGLMLSAVAEKMNGSGNIVDMHPNNSPIVTGLSYLNLSPEELKNIKHISLDYIPEILKRLEGRAPHQPEYNDRVTIKPEEYTTEKAAARAQSIEDVSQLLMDGLDSLIIATRHDPASLLFPVFPLLQLSSPFVVFSPYLQPLAECADRLRSECMAIQVDVVELWTREYQVLPDRTHPEMKMTAQSGYILTGIKVMQDKERRPAKKPRGGRSEEKK
ncbi:hypothetical protein PROFUN_08139 [Planoprotostelium fungivorum]|uniref:tRNA (adenine(58)-N(1))-methyltransferase non-catalytic subunit TRM6 n=1 Tax=Planoprotostelium fungivorum TaxID=1890364 RepID=A0A2P6MQI8_9EUKA|nr:hypothetical protein PROFUN_08139 [Planoprotostelium fungivorum]